MKTLLLFLALTLAFWSCSTKKAETTTTPADSLVADSALATTPASAMLAYSPIEGFSANKKLELPDSINYFLLSNEEELNQKFGRDKTTATPDFIINYVVAVACRPSKQTTTISIDKVQTGDSSLDVYLTITRGETGKTPQTPSALFAIERREGYPVMQFYVNGKKDKALVVVQ